MMYLNVITPCSRVENLPKIAESLQAIPTSKLRWIVVFDSPKLPDKCPPEAECYAYWKRGSIAGNAQRNYALDKISKGHVYLLDDDTLLHPSLWKNIKDLDNHDFISFRQVEKGGALRLRGDRIEVNYIDTGNFIFSHSLPKSTRFIEDKYDADGYFAKELIQKAHSPIYIPEDLSIYNALR